MSRILNSQFSISAPLIRRVQEPGEHLILLSPDALDPLFELIADWTGFGHGCAQEFGRNRQLSYAHPNGSHAAADERPHRGQMTRLRDGDVEDPVELVGERCHNEGRSAGPGTEEISIGRLLIGMLVEGETRALEEVENRYGNRSITVARSACRLE